MTNDENMKDMVSKGRQAKLRGSTNGNSKLHERQIPEIRMRLASGETQISIAKEFGVTQTMIGFIKRRVRWAHVR